MQNAFKPVAKESLADRLARRIQELIQTRGYAEGDRLPSIMEMARRFQVGHPSVREALKRLQAIGVVEVRHGSGVYVRRSHDVLVFAAPSYSGEVTKKLLVDLVEARIALEPHSIVLAARNASAEDLAEMRRLLDTAGENLGNSELLNSVNMSFHREIARASGNTVLAQITDVLRSLFSQEQRLILGIHGPRARDHEEHLGLLEALEKRDAELCEERMRSHLAGVRDAILKWDPVHHPLED
jgi:GntR family transcriptional regulator, transcriptional repressor for pyruvate dehydrogenase complex